MCAIAAMWSWSICTYLTCKFNSDFQGCWGRFCWSWFTHRQKKKAFPRQSSLVSEAEPFKRVHCSLCSSATRWPLGRTREKSPKRLWLERLISPHPASKYHDCILGDSLPSASKAKNKSLSTLSSSHPSAFPSLYVFVSGLTADTSLMTKTINFLAGAK